MTTLHISLALSSLPGTRANPWVCRMAAALCDPAGAEIDSFECSIRAEGRTIDTQASRIHGITTPQAERSGVFELLALGMVCGMKAKGKARTADYPGFASYAREVVCWDAPLLREVIGRLFSRHGEPAGAWIRPGLRFVSLQQIARIWCVLPAPDDDKEAGQYRLPTRDEAANKLLGFGFRALPHAAEDNLRVERALYRALSERGALEKEAA